MQSMTQSTPTRRSQSQRRQATRNQILDACIAVIEVKGFTKCSMAAVAENAKITTGAIQHHFDSKSELICAVVTDRIFPTMDSPTDSIKSGASLTERCRYMVEAMWEYYGHPHYLVVWEILFATKNQTSIQETIAKFFGAQAEELENHVVELFRDLSISTSFARHCIHFCSSHLRGLALSQNAKRFTPSVEPQLASLSKALEKELSDHDQAK